MVKTPLLVAVFSIALGLAADDVSGKWVGDVASGESAGNPTARIYLTLHRSGDAISGTLAYKDESKQVRLENPSLKDDELTFEVHDNPTRVVRFMLTIGKGSLNGEATSGGQTRKIAMTRPN